MDIILASNSPRRKEIMDKLKVNYRIVPSDFNEREVPYNGDPADYVKTLSFNKAEFVALSNPESLVIGMDTVVYIQGDILNKPLDEEDAKNMMKLMSGKTHFVYTGFTLIHKASGLLINDHEVTEVKFNDLDESEIRKYLDTKDYVGKAGGYAAQSEAAIFIEYIKGDFYNVVGMPLNRIYRELKAIKVL
ncbi:MAG: nucleoside triphosphate pyrophosphatase [Clostridiaceae bacterium]